MGSELLVSGRPTDAETLGRAYAAMLRKPSRGKSNVLALPPIGQVANTAPSETHGALTDQRLFDLLQKEGLPSKTDLDAAWKSYANFQTNEEYKTQLAFVKYLAEHDKNTQLSPNIAIAAFREYEACKTDTYPQIGSAQFEAYLKQAFTELQSDQKIAFPLSTLWEDTTTAASAHWQAVSITKNKNEAPKLTIYNSIPLQNPKEYYAQTINAIKAALGSVEFKHLQITTQLTPNYCAAATLKALEILTNGKTPQADSSARVDVAQILDETRESIIEKEKVDLEDINAQTERHTQPAPPPYVPTPSNTSLLKACFEKASRQAALPAPRADTVAADGSIPAVPPADTIRPRTPAEEPPKPSSSYASMTSAMAGRSKPSALFTELANSEANRQADNLLEAINSGKNKMDEKDLDAALKALTNPEEENNTSPSTRAGIRARN